MCSALNNVKISTYKYYITDGAFYIILIWILLDIFSFILYLLKIKNAYSEIS